MRLARTFALRQCAEAAGFRLKEAFGRWYFSTLNFIKEDVTT